MEGVCVIGGAGEDISAFLKAAPKTEEAKAASPKPLGNCGRSAGAGSTATSAGEYKASPRARRLAESMGLHAPERFPPAPMAGLSSGIFGRWQTAFKAGSACERL